LMFDPIVGLILYYTPFGIQLAPITFSLLALTIFFATIALFLEINQNKQSESAHDPLKKADR
jgi:uncharacterized membrane protein